MMVSSRGRYALRAMIDLAENSSEKYVPMKKIAERQDISLKYLEKILPAFVANDLIEGVHGRGGGYRLKRRPGEIRVGDVLRLTEGDVAPVACMERDAEPCKKSAECRIRPMWKELNALVSGYVDSITIEDLMQKKNGCKNS